MPNKAIIYGWLHGGSGKQLYVYDNSNGSWGVTEHKNEATTFPSVEACKRHYLSKHSFPADYEHCTRNGYLKYLDSETNQLVLL